MSDNQKMRIGKCQICGVPQMSEPLRAASRWWQFGRRLRRMAKRRWWYLVNWMSEVKKGSEKEVNAVPQSVSKLLKPGDLVQVRSKAEIRATLDRWNQLRNCAFMEEMWDYCGTTQRVFKRVEKFLDERDYLMKKCKGIIILEGVYCEGTKDFGACDRSCFFFWREEWLKKMDV